MIVADTSAWVEFLRSSDHPSGRVLKSRLDDRDVATTEIVVMELLGGERPGPQFGRLRAVLLALPLLPLRGLADFEEAAYIHRTCRAAGDSIPSYGDCLVAVPAIRAGAPVLHKNADFEVIARHTDLELYPLET